MANNITISQIIFGTEDVEIEVIISWAVLGTPDTSGGTTATSDKPAYTSGKSTSISNKPAYTKGQGIASSNKPAFTQGTIPGQASSSKPAFTRGRNTTSSNKPGYTKGKSLPVTSNKPAFTKGKGTATSSVPAYIPSVARSNKPGYTKGRAITSSSKPAFTYGYRFLSENYIMLSASDSSISVFFRVLAEGYDDGTRERTHTIRKTIEGNIDRTVGGIQRTWSLIIKVRHTETEENLGTLQDLEDLYSLSNPNGTPSDIITLIDHHQQIRGIRILGKFNKSLLATQIEGTSAWYIVKLSFVEVT